MSIAVHRNPLVNQAERIDLKAPVNPLRLDLDHQFTVTRSLSVGDTVNLLIPLTCWCKRRKSTGETNHRLVNLLFHQFVTKKTRQKECGTETGKKRQKEKENKT